ncbi:MAG TPA: RidA family protein [Gemmatimonadales bacterium]|nr:RidA family protein [Gemmatimonadales bacterium]
MSGTPRSVLLTVCSVLTLVGCDRDERTAADPVYVPMTGTRPLPFSAAVRVGDILYLSGQLGTDSTGALVPGGIEPETRQAMENIRTIVEANGSSMDRVVKCLVMLADMREWGAMNGVYVTFFPDHLPARSAMGSSGLALGARVEIECIAAVAEGDRAQAGG